MTLQSPVDARERRAEMIDSAGERIYAEMTGSGSPVVLCHGLGGNHAIWWRQIDSFAREHAVLTWDQRGFGNSTSVTGQVGVELGSADLLAVLDAFGLDRVHLVGQSMGAFVALRFALEHPQRAQSLVLSTTLAGADQALSRGLLSAIPPRPIRDRHAVVSVPFSEQNADLVILYNQISSFGTKPPTAMMLESMAEQEFTDEQVATLACPILVLAAENDPLCTPETMRQVSTRLPEASFAVVEGAAHSAYYEKPAEWNAVVLEFLAGV